MKTVHCGEILLVTLLLASSLLVGVTSSVGVYDPWCDLDDDGDIDIFDIVRIASIYGTSGENITKAGLEYDSGWINITDKRGQHFNVTHDLNSTDIIVDITGKTTTEGEPHPNHYGPTTHTIAALEWNQTYGGTADDVGYSVVQTLDGGYTVAGYTGSIVAGNESVWLVKTNVAGNHVWNQTYGGTNGDAGMSVVQTLDGGYAVAGYTYSFGAGDADAWLVKTDAAGNHVWNQTYGGTSLDIGWSVVQTLDGGYAITGVTGSFGDEFFGDAWLVKTDAAGNHVWNQTYGGTDSDYGMSVVQTLDGGYAVAGYTWSFGAGSYDFWLVKTDAAGNHVWNQTYGGANWERGLSVVQTLEGGYAITGYTDSYGAGDYDVWLVKTDVAGNHVWNQTYGGTSADRGYSVVQTVDGGYAIVGHTYSFGAGDRDVWFIKTDAVGNQVWNKTYGGTSADVGLSVVQATDGGYMLAGYTASFGAGNQDFWLVKAYALGAYIEVEYGLAWTASTLDTITLYRGQDDPYWNYVRVRVWKIRETP